MILIEHGTEPAELTRAKKKLKQTPDVVYCYENLPSSTEGGKCHPKEVALQQLMREQGHICAYCMRRIDETPEHAAHIEHWIPQTKGTPEQSLEYRNMLAVCEGGGKGVRSKSQTCDRRRGDADLAFDPRDQRHIATIYYDGEGRIYSSDESLQKCLDDTLNLNTAAGYLLANREGAFKKAEETIQRCYDDHHGNKQSSLAEIEKKVEQLERKSEFRDEYIGVVIWRLKDHLRRRRP